VRNSGGIARLPLRIVAALAVITGLVACDGDPPAPSGSGAASAPVSANCADDLPERTSPLDVPAAILYVNGDDLPPVVGDVEWLGGDQPATYEPPRPVHLEPYTVLQTRGQADVSLRMSDGVRIESWTVDAVPFAGFRAGDFETDSQRWSEGANEPTDLVCVPITNGSWGIVATLTFADDGGTGTYYWRLIVTEVPGA
jgi:hypothetical protein